MASKSSELVRPIAFGGQRSRRLFLQQAAKLIGAAGIAAWPGMSEVSAEPLASRPDWLKEPIRGITISCFRFGPGEWDGPNMAPTLDELVDLGANWVTIHPYARLSRSGRLRWSAHDEDTV